MLKHAKMWRAEAKILGGIGLFPIQKCGNEGRQEMKGQCYFKAEINFHDL